MAAEGGRIAIALQLLSGLPYRVLIVLAVCALAVVTWVLPFEWIARVFGTAGCACSSSSWPRSSSTDWGQVAGGLVPGRHEGGGLLVYLYFVVGLLGAALAPYEVYFYPGTGWLP